MPIQTVQATKRKVSNRNLTDEQTREILERFEQSPEFMEYMQHLGDWQPGTVQVLSRVYGVKGPNLTAQDRLKKQAVYLAVLAEYGIKSRAASVAGINHVTVDYWQQGDKKFKQAYKEALEIANDVIRMEIHRRAITGIMKDVYYKGEVVGQQREFSDTLLMFLAKSRMAEFKESTQIDIQGQVQLVPWAEATMDDIPDDARRKEFQDQQLQLQQPQQSLPAGKRKPITHVVPPSNFNNSATDNRAPLARVTYKPSQQGQVIEGEFTEGLAPDIRGDDAPSNTDELSITFGDEHRHNESGGDLVQRLHMVRKHKDKT